MADETNEKIINQNTKTKHIKNNCTFGNQILKQKIR